MKGVYSVLPTPFFPDGRIDSDSLARTVDLFLEAGVDGLTALGVTSEAARLTEAERSFVQEFVLKRVNGRIPVVVGTSTEGTLTCVEFSKSAAGAGASAVMISPPRMVKLNSDAVVRHYQTLVEAIDIPVVIQDYPPVSGYAMEASLLVRIMKEVSQART